MTRNIDIMCQKRAALFDLDGVIFDTEPQYNIFWEGVCRDFMPDQSEMIRQMKGQTLTYILERWFSGEMEKYRQEIVARVNAFEPGMSFDYVAGFTEWLDSLRSAGILTAVVTSSNAPKMANVYRARPEFKGMFDAILMAEDFTRSKPDPQCYLRAAERLGVRPEECVVFEDSINGMKSGRAAGMYVVGIMTSLPIETVKPLSDSQFKDFTTMHWETFR